jgi:hypothetical protein
MARAYYVCIRTHTLNAQQEYDGRFDALNTYMIQTRPEDKQRRSILYHRVTFFSFIFLGGRGWGTPHDEWLKRKKYSKKCCTLGPGLSNFDRHFSAIFSGILFSLLLCRKLAPSLSEEAIVQSETDRKTKCDDPEDEEHIDRRGLFKTRVFCGAWEVSHSNREMSRRVCSNGVLAFGFYSNNLDHAIKNEACRVSLSPLLKNSRTILCKK